jgi:hypothetical protein
VAKPIEEELPKDSQVMQDKLKELPKDSQVMLDKLKEPPKDSQVMQDKLKEPPKDSQVMQDKLKGDSFPEGEGAFLDDSIRAFFDELFENTKLRKSDVIRKANIARTYGYQLMDGQRLGKRDYYLNIALAMSLDFKMTQRLLAVTRAGGLHSLIKRDAAVIYAIHHGYSCEKTYDFLCELGLPPLDVGMEE